VRRNAMHVCRFDSASHLVGRARTYAAVKAAVLNAGRFSIFEATHTAESARLFTRLRDDPELEVFELGYPWIGVKLRAVKE